MILALETSTRQGSVALFDPAAGCTAWEASFLSERTHNSQLFAPLREALGLCGGRLSLIVVGTGPGSYSGVRVSIAVAGGLSLATGAPVLGLLSLGGYAAPGQAALVVGDARRATYFAASVPPHSDPGEAALIDAVELRAVLAEAQRARVPVCSADPSLWDAGSGFEGIAEGYPLASRLAEKAAALSDEEVGERVARPLEPHYLRAPYITTPK